MNKILAPLFFVLLLLPHASAWTAEPPQLEQQRKTFLLAEQAIKLGRISLYKKYLPELATYPLLPYLEYEYLQRRLSRFPNKQVSTFLNTHDNSPLASRLRHKWLNRLIQNKRWNNYIDFYQKNNSIHQQCNYRWAHLKTNQTSLAFDDIETIWVVAYSQPRTCDKLFAAWEKSGGMTADIVWKRIELAMNARKIRLARYLVRFLPKEEQRWAQLWLRVRRTPTLIKTHPQFSNDHAMRNTILVYGLKRIARLDSEKAANLWHTQISTRYSFSKEERYSVERKLAVSYALQKKPQALEKLTTLISQDIEHDNKQNLIDWRIRSALAQQQWDAALTWINSLNEKTARSQRWQYWRARSLAALQQTDVANQIYLSLAKQRSYYGFLAANQLGLPHQFENQPVLINDEQHLQLSTMPSLLRARELFLLNRIVKARREWNHTIKDLTDFQLQQAARLAHNWGWHDRAIMTMARSSNRDDLELRFPLVYQDKIMSEARSHNIEPAFAFALIRQESAFTTDARSHAGALGLMQLMPRTARQLAKNLGLKKPSKQTLINTDTNLKLGMHHLKSVLKRYNNNTALAAAAYNAGEHRVKQWIPKQGIIDSDLWAETLPFRETRNYVQNILMFAAIYDHLLGNKEKPLSARMPPVGTPDAVLVDISTNINNKNPS